MTESFLEGWRRDVSAKIGGLREVSPTHPLRLFYGSDDTARARFVIMTIDKPSLPQLSDIVMVERGLRSSDGRWTLSLTLLDEKVREVFFRLAEDLVRRSEDSSTEAQAISAIASTLDDWRRLLRARGRDVLGLDELRGLMGEMWVASNYFDTSTASEVIDSWVGPHGHPQDFAFAGVGTFEVKSVGPTSKRVKITSAEQLDSPGLPLQLIVLTVPSAAETSPGATTLVHLAVSLRQSLLEDGGDGTELDKKLDALGVDLRHSFYAETWFSFDTLQSYDVREDFPAIRASRIPPEISGVEYQIARSSITPFEVETRSIA